MLFILIYGLQWLPIWIVADARCEEVHESSPRQVAVQRWLLQGIEHCEPSAELCAKPKQMVCLHSFAI
jgi:hypothetical protein